MPQIVKLIFFFYSSGVRFLFFLFFLSFSFLSFFPVFHSCFRPPTISLLSLFPSARRLYLPLWRNLGRSIKPSRSLSQWVLFFFFFFFFDLMVDSVVVVWVMDSAFWIGIQRCCMGCRLRFWVSFGSLIDQLGWGFKPLSIFYFYYYYYYLICEGIPVVVVVSLWQWWL